MYGFGAHYPLISYAMRKNNTPFTPQAASIILHELCCAQCRSRIAVKQQTHSITAKIVGDNHKDVAIVILEASDMVRITVDKHNCMFHVLMHTAANSIMEFPVRSPLSEWKYLAEHGLEQSSRDTIVNVAHVYKVEKNRVYLKHLEKSVVVTESYGEAMSKALKFWLNMDHRFSC